MNAGSRPPARTRPSPSRAELGARLEEAEATLHAIRSGGVDALVVEGRKGPRVYTLEGAEHAYRLLIETMNEGALMLSSDGLVLYANRRCASMLGRPLEKVTGHSIHSFLSAEDQAALRPLMKRAKRPASPIQVVLHAANGHGTPALISVCHLGVRGQARATFGMVVTDMTEARRSERRLRSLSHSLIQTQEVERRRLAVELHDRASQNLGALLIRLRMLAESLPARDGSLRSAVASISELVGETADVVEGISKNLRPSVLEIMGLVPALRTVISEFVKRTGIAVDLECGRTPARLSAEAELVLYRVLEEALSNVEKHAAALKVTVHLGQRGSAVELTIRDEGVGFDPDHESLARKGKDGVGLLGLRERIRSVGGALKVRSTRGIGTEVEARIPRLSRAPNGGRRASDEPNPRSSAATGPLGLPRTARKSKGP